MENQEKDKIGQVFLNTFIKLNRKSNSADERLLAYQFDVFQSIVIDLNGTNRLLFNTLFARLAYLSVQYKLPPKLLFELHLYRKENAHLNVFREIKEVYLLGLYLIRELLHLLYDVEIPRELSNLKKPEYAIKEKSFKQFIAGYVRGVLLRVREDGDTFDFVAEGFEQEDIVLSVEDLDLFQELIKWITKPEAKEYLPMTVGIREIGVDDKGVWYPKWFVLEPDYLVDVTSVADCFAPRGARAEYFMLKKFIPTTSSIPLLTGHLANFALDELINDPKMDYRTLMGMMFKMAPIEFALMTDRELMDLMKSVQRHFDHLKRVLSEDFKTLDLQEDQCVVEPSFYAPTLGLQGRLDVLYRKPGDALSIIELKSGRPFMENMYGLSVNHFTQTLLYDLMLRSVYPGKISTKNFILYSKPSTKNLRFAPTVKAAQMEALNMRNAIYKMERTLASKEGVLSLVNEMKLKHFPGAMGFTKTDIGAFEKTIQSLDDIELQYFSSMSAFVGREQHLAKTGSNQLSDNNGLATLWLDSKKIKEERFAIISKLEIKENKSMKSSPLIILEKTKDSNRLANFRVGDIVVLKPWTENDNNDIFDQIIRASIIELSGTLVIIKLRSRQYNQDFFNSSQYWNIEPDVLDSGFRKMYQSLYQFCQNKKDFRDLILGRKAPAAPRFIDPFESSYSLTERQNTTLHQMIQSQDYFLLWGPPGTGKTSVLLAATVEYYMKHTDSNVLLLAYTNRAVDEICTSMRGIKDKCGEDFIRIGSSHGTGAEFREHLLDNKVEALQTRKNLKEQLDKTRIFTGTSSSIMGRENLFKIKDFDIVIIDEASQILEPMLIGLLHHFKKFILIGDHKQLPAVVVQTKENSKTNSVDLIELGIIDLRTAFFERLYLKCLKEEWSHAVGQLDEQGRMHQEIQAFVNDHFYEKSLKCLELNDRQQRPFKDLFVSSSYEKFQALSQERMLFVESSGDPDFAMAKSDEKEAQLVGELVKALKNNVVKKEGVNLSIGVITPFRAQIAQILDVFKQEGISKEKVTVDTVERYQGSARDIIIYSTVVNSESRLEQILSDGENATDRKLNVVISRAREQFILLGNRTILNKDRLYNRLMATCKEFSL